MTRDGEIPAIFNPKRVRAPSVVVTGGDSPNGPYGGFTNIINASNPQITHSDSLNSNHPEGGSEVSTTPSLQQPSANTSTTNAERVAIETPTTEVPQTTTVHSQRFKVCKDSCCSELAQKMYFGVCVTVLVTASWVGATHCIKFLYLNRGMYTTVQKGLDTKSEVDDNATIFHSPDTTTIKTTAFNAPFFASWFCTNFAFLFFPIYILGRVAVRKCDKPREILGDVLRGFRDRGFTIGRFLNRCLTFCILWVLTTYLYALSLRALYATDVMALFATNVACVYLLSWVILHEQFVGVRIVAVILCDTGIALLAYMDGITGSPTLGGVVLAALAAAGYAVFKVMFRKVMGDPPVGQIAFAFTTLGFLNAALLWPVCVALYLTGTEVMLSDRLPWIILLIASILLLVFHILTQFSSAVTYNMFVTLGLITAVPVSGALDVVLYSAQFAGMKLAGVILIAVGFFLVMFPENWPDYITRLLRKTGRAILQYQCCCEFGEIDYDNSKYHLVGSQCESSCVLSTRYRDDVASIEMGSRSSRRFSNGTASNRHRLSDGLHSFPSSLPVRPCEMTDLSPTLSQLNYMVTDSATTGRRQPSGTPSTSSGSGLFSSYFGGDEPSKKKTCETPFFSLGFRRKSSAYYAATD